MAEWDVKSHIFGVKSLSLILSCFTKVSFCPQALPPGSEQPSAPPPHLIADWRLPIAD